MTHVLPTEKISPLTRRQTDCDACDACARARRSPVYYTAVNDNDSARIGVGDDEKRAEDDDADGGGEGRQLLPLCRFCG